MVFSTQLDGRKVYFLSSLRFDLNNRPVLVVGWQEVNPGIYGIQVRLKYLDTGTYQEMMVGQVIKQLLDHGPTNGNCTPETDLAGIPSLQASNGRGKGIQQAFDWGNP